MLYSKLMIESRSSESFKILMKTGRLLTILHFANWPMKKDGQLTRRTTIPTPNKNNTIDSVFMELPLVGIFKNVSWHFSVTMVQFLINKKMCLYFVDVTAAARLNSSKKIKSALSSFPDLFRFSKKS